jgi:hypothetical protein
VAFIDVAQAPIDEVLYGLGLASHELMVVKINGTLPSDESRTLISEISKETGKRGLSLITQHDKPFTLTCLSLIARCRNQEKFSSWVYLSYGDQPTLWYTPE